MILRRHYDTLNITLCLLPTVTKCIRSKNLRRLYRYRPAENLMCGNGAR